MELETQSVLPADILGAADSITPTGAHEFDLIPNWSPSDVYLGWAKESLALNTPHGLDAAVCYAKRAACRRIDGLAVHNHFRRYLGKPYPEKLQYLRELGISIPEIVRDLIISPRNEIEHEYCSADMRQAKHAVELSELFLTATATEVERLAIISLGWCIGFRYEGSDTSEKWEFNLKPTHDPMLLIDAWNGAKNVLILHPRTSEIIECSLRLFKVPQITTLAKKLRDASMNGGNRQRLTLAGWKQLEHDLRL